MTAAAAAAAHSLVLHDRKLLLSSAFGVQRTCAALSRLIHFSCRCDARPFQSVFPSLRVAVHGGGGAAAAAVKYVQLPQ